MNKITVKEFVEGYENRVDDLREKYVKDNLEIREYVPYLEKLTMSNRIVELSSYDKDNNVEFNSPVSYILYTRSIIELYTNLMSESDSFLDEYDLLCKSGLLNIIINDFISENELTEFNTIYKMVKDDFVQNNYEIHGFISKQIQRFEDMFKVIFTEETKAELMNLLSNTIKNYV